LLSRPEVLALSEPQITKKLKRIADTQCSQCHPATDETRWPLFPDHCAELSQLLLTLLVR
jgi:hypothetical protein